MNDDELRALLGTLDRVEPAPPDVVDRVWTDVESLLSRSRPAPTASNVVMLPTVEEAPGGPPEPRHRTIWTAVAGLILIVGLGVFSFVREGAPDPTVPGQSEPPSVATTTVPEPITLERVCATFRASVAGVASLGDDSFDGDEEALRVWGEALDGLIDDVDAGGLLDATDPHRLDLRLLRTALRTAEISLADDRRTDAATAVSNAADLRDGLSSPGSPLLQCFDV